MDQISVAERMVRRGRRSTQERLARYRLKSWHLAQCAIAAGLAWLIAKDLLGHETPFFAAVAAVVSLGTSYGQRLRRVAEVAFGVALGVLLGDLIMVLIGSGWWQLSLVVFLAMTCAVLLDSGTLFTNQAAIQAIIVMTLLPEPSQAFTRWFDAVIGGVVALVAALVAPQSPLRRPRAACGEVAARIAELLHGCAEKMRLGDSAAAMELLAEARETDSLIRDLQHAADEGLSTAKVSAFWRRSRTDARAMAELVAPLDRAIRTLRVLTRQVAVATYRRRPIPTEYADLCDAVAAAVDLVVRELAEDRMPVAARPVLLQLAARTGQVPRDDELTSDAILALLRAMIVDLLMVSGMGTLDASDAMPEPRHTPGHGPVREPTPGEDAR